MSNNPPVTDHRQQLLRRPAGRNAPAAPAQPLSSDAERPIAIAISREVGAPAEDVALAIGQRLDWPIYDRQIIDLVAKESGYRPELLQQIDEHDKSWLVETLSSFGHHRSANTTNFAHHLVHVLETLAAKGNCIIVGRGASAFLPPETTLRINVIADLADRVEAVARLKSLSESDARRHVQDSDRERAKFVANHFHRDVHDAHNFDLVLNASRLDVPACATLIAEALQTFRTRVARPLPK